MNTTEKSMMRSRSFFLAAGLFAILAVVTTGLDRVGMALLMIFMLALGFISRGIFRGE